MDAVAEVLSSKLTLVGSGSLAGFFFNFILTGLLNEVVVLRFGGEIDGVSI